MSEHSRTLQPAVLCIVGSTENTAYLASGSIFIVKPAVKCICQSRGHCCFSVGLQSLHLLYLRQFCCRSCICSSSFYGLFTIFFFCFFFAVVTNFFVYCFFLCYFLGTCIFYCFCSVFYGYLFCLLICLLCYFFVFMTFLLTFCLLFACLTGCPITKISSHRKRTAVNNR
jgi:hypothetical protein